MIFDAIAKVVTGVLTGLFGLFPAYTLPAGITDLGHDFGAWIGTANQFFPVTALGACVAVVLAVRLFVGLFALVVWIYDKIPLKFT